MRLALLVVPLLYANAAHAQVQAGSCSSDGTSMRRQFTERLLDADCTACWTDPATRANRRELAIDWVLPSPRGDEAAMSAVALREARERAESLGLGAVGTATVARHRVMPGTVRVRVAHGLALRGYVGASITVRGVPRGTPVTGWLALVERLPSGTEGSPVARQLVRNLLVLDWLAARPAGTPLALTESRAMSLPEGMKPERVAVVGWVQDAQGRILATAESQCRPAPD